MVDSLYVVDRASPCSEQGEGGGGFAPIVALLSYHAALHKAILFKGASKAWGDDQALRALTMEFEKSGLNPKQYALHWLRI